MIIEELTTAATKRVARATASTAGSGMRAAFYWKGVPFAAFFLALYEQFDHHLRKEQLTKEYLPEIAAKCDKPLQAVTIDDMQRVAEENPVIQEKLKRSETRRNIAIGVNIIGTVLGACAVFYLAFPVGAAIAFAGFIALDMALTKAGKTVFGLNEPSVKALESDPSRQAELSISSQITYLEALQQKRLPINQEQINTLFSTANTQIEPEKIKQLTYLLNSGRVRVQEMAFTLSGDASGVMPLENERETILEVANRELQQKLVVAQQKAGEIVQQTQEGLGKFSTAAKQKASSTLQGIKERLPFDAGTFAKQRENKNPITPEGVMQSRQQIETRELTPA